MGLRTKAHISFPFAFHRTVDFDEKIHLRFGSGSMHRLDGTKVAHNHNTSSNITSYLAQPHNFINIRIWIQIMIVQWKPVFFLFLSIFLVRMHNDMNAFRCAIECIAYMELVELCLGNDHNLQRQPLRCGNIAISIAYSHHSASISFKRIQKKEKHLTKMQ